ncbi:hypothetical protein AAZV13_09G238400 [Glycine max]
MHSTLLSCSLLHFRGCLTACFCNVRPLFLDFYLKFSAIS